MTLGKLPYTTEQVIQNALCLLMVSNIFLMREFNTWETMTVKTYPALKTFIHKVYSHHLNSMELQNTSSSLGYTAPTHNMYNVLGNGDDNNDSATDITVATIAGAAMIQSTIGQGTAAGSIHSDLLAAINQSIAPAFNQVIQNQTVPQNQIAAMSMAQPPPMQPPLTQQYMALPIPHVAFPMQHPFQAPMQQQQYQQVTGYGQGQQGQYNGGQGGQGGCERGRGSSNGGHPRGPSFAAQIRAQNWQGQMLPFQGGQMGIFAAPQPFRGQGPFGPTAPNQQFYNVVKCHAN
jgi:hypothetical protein